VLSPADGAVVGTVVEAATETADRAIEAARRAFPGWSETPAEERARALERAADLIDGRRGRFIHLLQAEGGKTLDDALSEVREAIDFCRYYAAEGRRLFGADQPLPGPTGESNELDYRGRGVFVCISPWNFPLAIFTGQIAAALAAGTLPPFIGIRIKAMSSELHARSLRTLDLFVTALVKSGKRLPDNFAITVPKVMTPAHVDAVVRSCASLERRLKLKRNSLLLELMFETPQSILGPDGSSALRGLVAAGAGRVRGAHLGVYDYTALVGITAAWQHPRHLACDFARHMMQVALAQSGVTVVDGGSNFLPIPPHATPPARALTDAQRRENIDVVHRAWKTQFADITHALVNGFYQGWDLHPAQLPSRYAAVYAFYLGARVAATARLAKFFDKAARAGAVFDDAATGQALVNFFSRAWSSGAITAEELKQTGLSPPDLQGQSFPQILANRDVQG
jgi:hypothetical protein